MVYISIVKFIMYYFSIYLYKQDIETSTLSSIILTSFSELVFFVIFLLDIDKRSSSIISVSSIFSILLIPILFKLFDGLFMKSRINTIGFARKAARKYVSTLDEYTLVIGMNKIGLLVAKKLGSLIQTSIIIDDKLDVIAKYGHDNFMYLDALDQQTYQILNIDKKVKVIIICAQINDVNINVICSLIRSISNTVKIAIISLKSCSSNFFAENNIYYFHIKGNKIDREISDIIDEIK